MTARAFGELRFLQRPTDATNGSRCHITPLQCQRKRTRKILNLVHDSGIFSGQKYTSPHHFSKLLPYYFSVVQLTNKQTDNKQKITFFREDQINNVGNRLKCGL